jgi:hypothetical protein
LPGFEIKERIFVLFRLGVGFRPQASDFRRSAMSRDPDKLNVFHLADELTCSVQKLLTVLGNPKPRA